jgi:hypothetical protein
MTMTDMRDESYNGWTNYETWAISLMLNNDQVTYESMRDFMARWGDRDKPYTAFVQQHGIRGLRVGANYADRFTFATRKANHAELDEMMREIQ